MVSKLLDPKSISVSYTLGSAIGFQEAAVLQQLYYCLTNPNMVGTEKNGRKWIRNPIQCQDQKKQQQAKEHGKAIDWLGNFPGVTVSKLRRIFAKLEARGLVLTTKLRAAQWDHCKYYSIDLTVLNELLKALSLPICSFPTNRFDQNEQMDVTTVRKSYQDTNSILPLQELERKGGDKILTKKKETPKNQKLLTDQIQESVAQESISQFDENSATVASGFPPIDVVSQESQGVSGNNELREFQTPMDVVSQESQGVSGNDELREFQTKLEDLGKQLGKKNPVAWAYTIVKNMGNGKLPCTYWKEFKSGVPLGTSDQREWEIAPGVPCRIAVQCLEQDFLSRPGTTPQEAALKAARTIACPNEMSAVWESIKARVMFKKDEWDRQAKMGVQSPVLDPWMVPKPPVSVQEVAIALHEIQSAALSPALQPAQEMLSASKHEIQSATLPPALQSVQEMLPASEITDEVEVEVEDAIDVEAKEKAKIFSILKRHKRPSTKRQRNEPVVETQSPNVEEPILW